MGDDVYARSDDVHRALTALFAPWCVAGGFRKLPGKRCRFVKLARHHHVWILAFEVQCNSFGGSGHGGSFTLNAGAGAISPGDLSGRHARILRHCSEQMVFNANRLAAALAEVSPQLKDTDRPWQPGADNWCRYYTREDVERWGHFLIPFLADLMRGLLKEVSMPTDEFFDD